MKSLLWSQTFVRAYKRAIVHHPELRHKIEPVLDRLSQDPFHPSLHSHKLKGVLAGAWACTVDYDCRIIFEFVKSSETET